MIGYQDKKIIFTSTESSNNGNGVYKNLDTINSQHKDSVKIDNFIDDKHKTKVIESKIE